MHFFLYGGILSSTWWFFDHGVAILPNLSFKKIAMRPPLNKKDFSFYAYHPTLQTTSDGVKCNDSPIITLQRLLTTTYSMLHYKHNQRSWMSNNKPYQYTSHTPMQVSMPESLYAVVYSETAFRGLTQHPSHFHTISAAKAFVDQYCKPYNQSAYIIQVPVVASSIQS